MCTCAARRPEGTSAGPGSRSSSITPAGSASARGAHADVDRDRLVLDDAARADRALDAQRRATPRVTHSAAASGSATKATPATYSGSASNVAAVSARTAPSSAVAIAGRTARP